MVVLSCRTVSPQQQGLLTASRVYNVSLLHTYLLQPFCGIHPESTEGHLQLQDSVLRTAPGIAEQRVLHLFATFELATVQSYAT
jgi:hypothetical protein